ncbi:uncharacterized protein LOC141589715 [Silene latifolia]|uniref:uncharacterized protein LOC141589715 n=1 Tax=Silene latifolia TaxID=37657 RepID=UPI003D773B53
MVMETIEHLFRDCPVSRTLWACSEIGTRTDMGSHLSVEKWIIDWVSYLGNLEGAEERLVRFFAMISCLWSIRNRVLFQGMDFHPVMFYNPWTQIVGTADRVIAVAQKETNLALGSTITMQTERHLWIRESNPVALSGTGERCCYADRRIIAESPSQAEGLGVRMDLLWAREQGIRHLEISTDCFSLVGQFCGGIWLYWRPEFVSVLPVKEHPQYITIEVSRNGELPWFFSVVYASPNPSNRVELWSELERFARNNDHPWMLAGDYNETRSLTERHGGNNNMARRCELFNNWIESCQLIELEFSGPAHTWSRGNSEATRQSARLDRALCNSEWGTMFGDASRWNEDVFGNIFRQKRQLIARIEGCQRILSTQRQSHLIKLEAKLRKELDDILEREELLWYQKSRVEFIRDGDRNTSYFHVSTLIRRWKNRINTLKNDEGVWIDNSDDVKKIVVEYYKNLYTDDTPDDFDADIPYDLFQEFSHEHWTWLNKYYSRTEIDNVIMHMESLKAPGPDGFQALFYQKQWDIVRRDVYDMVMKALEGKGMPAALNDTHIVLIPKVPAPEHISQFRPISLCNVAYKIISKTIANRIRKVLPWLISENQSGFVPERQITDNIVVFQEAIHTMRKKTGKTGYMAIKIDLEKAYDRLKWSFIRRTLTDMGFPLLMIDTVMECVTTTTMKILWNGESTETFKPSRGLDKQAIDTRVRNKDWIPIPICKHGPSISNIFFADDMVLFAEARADQAHVINYVLDNFCRASGEKVSVAKSKLFFSKNTDSAAIEEIRDILGFEVTNDLGTYLGMPTINGRVTKETFAHLEEKFNRRLAGWQTKHLSLAGRNTLIQSTLSTMANYSMQTAKIPRSICDNLDKKTRRFLWGGTEEQRKIHLISWDTVQKPKSMGGLGIRSSRQSNAAFLTKLGWRVLTEPQTLWARVLRNKYCNGRCDVDMFQPKPNMSNVWAGITSQAKIINRGSTVAVGNGRKTLFWDHSWVDSGSLSDRTILPLPEDILGATVSDMWDESSGWKWDVFSNFLSREDLLKIAAYSLSPEPYLEDSLYWNASSSDWVSKNASNSIPFATHDWSMKFALTCWWIWRWRNNVSFGRANENPTDPITFLRGQFECTRKALDPFSLFIPIPGNPGPAGSGGILRDEAGNFVRAFHVSCGICNSMRAEMKALVIGLELARSLRVRKLLVHMDNSQCVSFVQEEQLLSNSLRPLVQRCIELTKLEGWTVKIDHVFREANRAADCLANAGVNSSISVTYFDAPPDGLRNIIREDVLGVVIPRIVRI